MSVEPKSATIQVRVLPLVKETSEKILWRIGLSMSDAVELFLRRVIIDQRIPFEVVAVQNFMISGFSGEKTQGPVKGEPVIRSTFGRSQSLTKEKGERPREKFKKFSGGRTSGQFKRSNSTKKKGN